MRTLLSERFAPTTSSMGFLRLEFDRAVRALADWRSELHEAVSVSELSVGFPEALLTLEPLVGGARPRELLVEASGGWTAYFDCLLRGTDAVSAIGYLTRRVGCYGLAVRTVPHTLGLKGTKHGRYGSVQFEMFGPDLLKFLNYVRTIEVTHDGSRWVFGADGEEQPFEETRAYEARRVRDRFTSEMLERYCQALGLDVFDPAAYGPRAVLVTSQVEIPPDGHVMTFDQVQRWLEIVPGVVDGLPG